MSGNKEELRQKIHEAVVAMDGIVYWENKLVSLIDTYAKERELTSLSHITAAHYDPISGTYDYDGIAESVFDRIRTLEQSLNKEDKA